MFKDKCFNLNSYFVVAALFFIGGCAPKAQPRLELQSTHLAPVAALERAMILKALREGTPVGVLLGPLGSSGEPPPSSTPALECLEFRNRLGSSITQGKLSVPEDWSHPDGAKIEVFYYARLIRDPQGQVIRPVVFFNGGPASDSHSSYDLLEGRSSTQSFSMVYLDQRGTGCSDPYPSSPINEQTARRLSLYGSQSIVRDAEALRASVLGPGSRWTAFGQSFGGSIVHRYVATAPEGLNAAFSHGSALVTDATAGIAERLASQLRVSQEYFQLYPDDLERLREIRAAIAPARCFDDGTLSVCGPAVIDAVSAMLGFRVQWRSMHQWLGRILGPSGRLEEGALSRFVRTFALGASASGDFAAAVLSRQEITGGYSDLEICEKAQERLKQRAVEDPASWPINECRLLAAIRSPWEKILAGLGAGDPLSLEQFSQRLEQTPGLRFFLYSGGLDVYSPASLFNEESQRLGARISYRNFPSSGHDGFFTEQALWNDLQQATDSI